LTVPPVTSPWVAGCLVLGGLVVLYLGATALVRGASSLALRLGMSPLVVGLTVVAFATSTPELFVVVSAVLEGREGISIGNVIGANLLNVGVILGATALIAPLKVELQLLRVDVPIMILAAAALLVVAQDGTIGRLDGALLFAALVAYLAFTVVMARRERREQVLDEFGTEVPAMSGNAWIDLAQIAFGVLLLAGGAELLVSGAVVIARAAGLSDAVVGITVVAAGTTLPELVTSVLAALRGKGDIAVGNVVGSCIFNVFCVLGGAAMMEPLDASGVAFHDMVAMLALCALALPLMWRGFIVNRIEGALLIGAYAVAIGFILKSGAA
jgi:cation:H+ antiporter